MFRYFLTIITVIFISQHTISTAKIKNNIIARVGNDIITIYEIRNKINLTLYLSKKEFNQENINRTKNSALDYLINNKVKNLELKKYPKFDVENKVNDYLISLSKKYSVNLEDFKKQLANRGIDYEYFKDEVYTELAWQNLIFSLFKDKIYVDESEIIKTINDVKEKQKNINQYNLSEIEFLSISKIEDENNLKKIMTEIKNTSFEEAAMKFSISESNLKGGKIGWVNEDVLSDEILELIKTLNIGQVTKPLYKSNSITIFKLSNKRSTTNKNINFEKLKEEIKTNKINKQLNIFSNSHLSKMKRNYLIEINEK